MDLSKLNPPQREAVLHGSGPLLVLAGAGSGKTRVITHRIAALLGRGVPARAIAALTFTNKAAEEMRHRVGALVGDGRAAAALTIGTFHALGLRLLQEEKAALGFPRGFTVFDQADSLGTVRELLRRVHEADRRFDAKAILTRISLAKNAFVAPEDYQAAEGDDYDAIAAELYPRYQAALRAFAAVDFDDLITETVRLAQRDPLVRGRWRHRYQHVLVDEYQDTNRAQLLLVSELTAEHGNLCVVGDDDQSIYGWRGADAANILAFERVFAGARVVVLEQNYRSTPTILAAANAVIANNPTRHAKRLWTARPDGPRLAAVVARAPDEEAKFVAGELERLHEQGRRWADLALLYRSNLQAQPFEAELLERRIPFALLGGQQFYERKEVKDLLAYLRVALHPRDEIALRRVINYPARGIGAVTVERLVDHAQRSRVTLWTALTQAGRLDPPLGGAARDAVTGFVATIEGLRATLGEDGAGVERAVRDLCDTIGLIDDLRAASPSLTAAQRRIDNVERLIASLAKRAAERPGRAKLAEYLRVLALDTSDSSGAADGADKVTLATLHGAKGLEFPVVFLLGLEEELLPHARTLTPHATDVSDPDNASDVAEERRLAYVGITRAREVLYLTRCLVRHRHGRERLRTPSRFWCEIPPELMDVRDLAAEAQAPVPPDELRNFLRTFSG